MSEITREGFITWVDTWISGCSENMGQCSGCLTDEKECQTAYDTFYKLMEKPTVTVTREDIAKAVQSCSEEFPRLMENGFMFAQLVSIKETPDE